MKYQAIILDFDGVILESNHIKDEAFRHTFSEYPRFIDEIMAYHKAAGSLMRFKKFKYIVESILHEPYDAKREEYLAKRFSAYVLSAIASCPFVKGAQDFLSFFYSQIPLFIVSVNPPEDLNTTLRIRGLEAFFRKVYAIEDKSQAIEEILKTYRWKAKDVVFIGDATSDYQFCQKVKVPFLGRNSGHFNEKQSFLVFSDLIEIKKYLIES